MWQVKLSWRYRGLGQGADIGVPGRKANNPIAPEVRAEMLALVRERYEDFSPTLAAEKLRELHGRRLSAETVRKWLVEEGCGGRGGP